MFQSINLEHYVSDKVVGHLAEKLDGSNVAVTSYNVIASRRNILLNSPTEQELQKTKFSGQRLHKVAEMFPKLTELQRAFKIILSAETEVVLYGELIQKGTATSTEDKFKYRNRGFEEGGYYIFGAGLALDESHETTTACKGLQVQGFSATLQHNDLTDKDYIILLMNDKLKAFLSQHNIENVIPHEKMCLTQGLELYCEKLLSNSLEGIVINFGNEILKWKGLDESYPNLFMDEIANLDKSEALKVIHEPILKVALKAREHWASLKKEKATMFLLEKAYKSALTKMKSLEERKQEGKMDQQAMDSFRTALEQEMIKDSHCDIHYQEKLPAFIQSKMKSI